MVGQRPWPSPSGPSSWRWALAVIAVVVLQPPSGVAGQKWKTDFGPCYRDCTADPEPRLCHYEFTEEIYASLSGACKNCSQGVEDDCYSEQCVPVDGVERTVYSVNRQVPGPAIHVCVGDVIQVDVKVRLPGHAEAIHWHGLPQERSPWYDGVAWVTQCPIIFGNTFRYEFVAEPSGTYFWHSHSGIHKVNGLVGALVIRESLDDYPHAALYDEDLPEHVVVLQDWMHVPAEFVLPGLTTRLTGQSSDCLLFNGQGQFTDRTTNETSPIPLATFEVSPGLRYRFRFINAGALSCPIQLQVEGHEMTVIAADGLDIQPQKANSLYTFSGERWDVVITAKTRPSRAAYWMYARTVGFCQNRGTTEQLAVLVYARPGGQTGSQVPSTAPPSVFVGNQLPTGIVVNSLGDCDLDGQVCATELSAQEPAEGYETTPESRGSHLVFLRNRFAVRAQDDIFAKDTYQKYLAFGPVELTAIINDIVYSDPSAPFLTQSGQAEWCDEDHLPARCRGKALCECPHAILLPYGAVIDVVIVDTTPLNPGDNSTTLLAHPMHMHGRSFAMMGMGTLRDVANGTDRADAVRAMYDDGTLPTASRHPALKDVLVLPGGGWIWYRFLADNPGAWFFHCHFQYHMASGMELVFLVGDPRQFPKPPPGFPTCGDYLYTDYYVTYM